MIGNNACALCSQSLEPILAEGEHWRLVLNRNQDLLGKCFLALRRHCEAVADLTSQEWAELHAQLRVTTEALWQTFCPDRFNYAFLQNQDRHVHLHVIPRYATPRVLAGEMFPDAGYPDHYAVGHPARVVLVEAVEEIVEKLRQAVMEAQVRKT
jgi:diadenosine tetraphosphate (Ap4A) HIT family hydrolase